MILAVILCGIPVFAVGGIVGWIAVHSGVLWTIVGVATIAGWFGYLAGRYGRRKHPC